MGKNIQAGTYNGTRTVSNGSEICNFKTILPLSSNSSQPSTWAHKCHSRGVPKSWHSYQNSPSTTIGLMPYF
jgi:hypothetical protein